jgi:Fructose-2,6-bisphosphatase
MKHVVLIRHGQSLAQQAAKHHQNGSGKSKGSRYSRKNDPELQDCFLSHKGVQQAIDLSRNEILLKYHFDLICTSPLTRAIATTCLWQIYSLNHPRHHDQQQAEGAGSLVLPSSSVAPNTAAAAAAVTPIPIVVRAEISEAGSRIPENQGRRVHVIVKDLKEKLSSYSTNTTTLASSSFLLDEDWIDFSMLPDSWPNVDCGHGGMLESFTTWLNSRQEMNVAVVCHCHVIRWLLRNAIDRVPNCEPIECILTNDGRWMLKSDFLKK